MVIGWGIVGLGAHVSMFMASAITKARNTKLVAICDVDNTKVKTIAVEYGVAGIYDSFEKMLKDPNLDVVYIATPNHLHADLTVKAAAAGKHVLCEKPMALTVGDCERMIEACEKNRVKLAIDYQQRLHPANLEARRLVMEGVIGEVSLAKVQGCLSVDSLSNAPGYPGADGWRMDPLRSGAGALFGIGIHFYDISRFILNSEVEEVLASFEPQGKGTIDEMAYAILKYANGTRGMVVTGIKVPHSENGVVLYGTKARLTCRVFFGPIVNDQLVLEGDSINFKATYPLLDMMSGHFTLSIENLNKCISENTEPISSGQNGYRMVKLSNAIIESAHTGKPVKVSG